MNRFASVTRPLMWFMAFMLAALTAGCGGGSGGGAPILGLPGVISFAVTPVAATIPVTGTQQFTAIETYSDGSTRNVTATSTWTSGTLAVAANPIAGLATGLTAGTTLITATSGGRTATANLTVNAATHVKLVVTPTTATIPVGGTQQYAAIETFSDGTTIDRTVTSAAGTTVWSTSDITKATVGTTTIATGLATDFGLATGVAVTPVATPVIIGASFTPVGAATLVAIPATLIVNAATSTKFEVKPVAATISVGGKQQFAAIETFSDGTTFDRTALSAWVSGTPGVATVCTGVVTPTCLVTDFGLATGVSAGGSAITASYAGYVGAVGLAARTAALTVTAATVVSINVAPPAATILIGGLQPYTLTALYSDGSSGLVTASGWTSATPAVATFAVGPPTGIATGVSLGTSAITATYTDPVNSVVHTSPLSPAAGGALLTVSALVPPIDYGPALTPVNLGLAGTYGIIARNAITISAPITNSHIYGDVALTLPAATMASLTGFTPSAVPVGCLTSPQVTGSINTPDNCLLTTLPALAPQPYTDLNLAYLDLISPVTRPVTGPLGAATVLTLAPLAQAKPVVLPLPSGGTFAPGQDLTGWILGPGTYSTTGDYGLSATLGPLVLDAGGKPDAVFIIRSTSAGAGFSSTDGSVVLQGKAQAKNVFWVMPGNPVIGAAAGGTFFQGTVVAGGGAVTTLGTFTIVQGRILTGAASPAPAAASVTLSSTNTITVPQ